MGVCLVFSIKKGRKCNAVSKLFFFQYYCVKNVIKKFPLFQFFSKLYVVHAKKSHINSLTHTHTRITTCIEIQRLFQIIWKILFNFFFIILEKNSFACMCRVVNKCRIICMMMVNIKWTCFFLEPVLVTHAH